VVVNIDKYIDESEANQLSGGYAVGDVSWSPEVVQDASAPPTPGTLGGSSIITHDHSDGVTTGLKFEFTVPDDYDSGNLSLQAVYAMSSAVASPNNVIVLSVSAEIADVTTGTVDTTSYPPTSISVTTPDNSTTVARSLDILTIAAADFNPGDKILFTVERLGAHASDLHTGAWKLIDYMVIYSGQIASRATIHQVEVYSDTDESPAIPGTLFSFATLDFPTTIDTEQSFQFTVPDNWDGRSDIYFRVNYAMSSAFSGQVKLETEGEIASVNSGVTIPLGVTAFIVAPPSDTQPHRTGVIRTISGLQLTAGDTILMKLARRGTSTDDTHTGDFKLLSTTVFIGQASSTSVSTETDEFYLPHRDFRVISTSGVNALQESAVFGSDFELWAYISSTVAGGRVDVEWQGRLRGTQTKIASIKIPVKGQSGGPTPQYQVKVYVEGSGATNVYTASALTPEITGNRTLITLTDADLSAQPTGERRYFVVVEAHLDAGEELRVGTPFVRQE